MRASSKSGQNWIKEVRSVLNNSNNWAITDNGGMQWDHRDNHIVGQIRRSCAVTVQRMASVCSPSAPIVVWLGLFRAVCCSFFWLPVLQIPNKKPSKTLSLLPAKRVT